MNDYGFAVSVLCGLVAFSALLVMLLIGWQFLTVFRIRKQIKEWVIKKLHADNEERIRDYKIKIESKAEEVSDIVKISISEVYMNISFDNIGERKFDKFLLYTTLAMSSMSDCRDSKYTPHEITNLAKRISIFVDDELTLSEKDKKTIIHEIDKIRKNNRGSSELDVFCSLIEGTPST